MNAATQTLCSMTLSFGVPIVLAGWERWRLAAPSRRRPPNEDDPPQPQTPLPGAGVAPPMVKPLPDCLIPKAAPARERELA